MIMFCKVSAVVVAVVCMVACGGDGGNADRSDTADLGDVGADPDLSNWPELPESTIVVQNHWSFDQVDAETEVSCLKDGVDSLKQQGFGNFVAAGQTIGSEGVEVVWQAMANTNGSERFAIRSCQNEKCGCVNVQLVDGKPQVETVSGAGGALPVVGTPILAKTLANTDLGSNTTLAESAAPLLDAPLPDPSPEQFKGKRRLIAASSFGDVHGVTFDGIVASANNSGRFTEVVEHPYVQASDIDTYLEGLHAQDVLFWFASTVRVEKGAGKFKPEGMTTNRGVYGDQTYDRERIEAHLSRAPLGGPGLVILAGAESFGTAVDGLTPYGSVENLVRSFGKRPRVIVGIRGNADANGVLRSGRVLVEKLTGGASLGDALTAATNELGAAGQNASWESNLAASDAAVYTLSPSLNAFWGAAQPSSGKFVGHVFIGAATQCTESETGATYHPEVAVSHSMIADIDVDGPFFWGQRADDEWNFFVFGVIENTRQGAAVRYWLNGSKGTAVQDLLLFGDGHFCRTGECNGKVTGPNDFKAEGIELYFTGTAEASEYRNEMGDLCKPSGIALTQGSGGPSWLVVGPK